MQMRCFNCHKPFALGKESISAALDELTQQNLGITMFPARIAGR